MNAGGRAKGPVSSPPTHPLPVHRAERFVFSVETAGRRHKVFQVQFQRRDGTIFVSFPYYQTTDGLVSLMTSKPENQPSASLSLEPGGKVTSHLVKYSDHPDGRAHFSQDRKVIAAIRKQAVPLAEVQGHLFSVQLQGLSHFDPTTEKDAPTITPKRTVLNFDLGSAEPEAVRFVGSLFADTTQRQRIVSIDPVPPFATPTGEKRLDFICSAPIDHPGERFYLALWVEPIQILDKKRDTVLNFIGAFDPPAVVSDPTRSTTFLALLYPVDDPAELKGRIGTIDFRST